MKTVGYRFLAVGILLLPGFAFAQHPMTFEDLAAIRRVGAPQVSPDGKWIAYDLSTIDLPANARHSAINLIASNGGTPKTITDGAKQDEGPKWSPDGKWIAYTSNRDQSSHQVYLYDVAAGTSRKLTDLDGGASNIQWLPDGSGIVVTSDVDPDCGFDAACLQKKKDEAAAKKSSARIITSLLYRHWTAWQGPTRTHIVYVPIGGGAARDLTPGPFDAPPFSLGGGDEFDISPDAKELVYARDVSPHPELSTNSDLYLVPITGGEAIQITSRTGADTSPKFSPDGRYIAYRSQARAGYESDLWELWLYDRATGKLRRLAPNFENWIESLTWAPDSESLFVTAPELGEEAIYRIRIDDTTTQLWMNGAPNALAVSPDGKTLYYDWSSLTSPTEIHAISTTRTANMQPHAITHENDDWIRSIAMGTTESRSWTGADGARVQGFVVRPPHFDPTKKYPGLLLIHGGPQGAWENAWSYRWNAQMFAARGYMLLLPNPRGSVGFGQNFVEQISGDWGGKPYTDIMNGVDMFAALPNVDGTHLGAAGASYGGYMIDWILGHTDRFKGLVSHDGVFNLISMYGATEELWFPEWEFGGNPWDNPELYLKWSPSMYVKNFKTPTLVVQGELDFRVPIDQGLQLFTALQRRGVPSKLIIFPDEGHWVLKPQNSKLWYQQVRDWLDQWVK